MITAQVTGTRGFTVFRGKGDRIVAINDQQHRIIKLVNLVNDRMYRSATVKVFAAKSHTATVSRGTILRQGNPETPLPVGSRPATWECSARLRLHGALKVIHDDSRLTMEVLDIRLSKGELRCQMWFTATDDTVFVPAEQVERPDYRVQFDDGHHIADLPQLTAAEIAIYCHAGEQGKRAPKWVRRKKEFIQRLVRNRGVERFSRVGR